MTEQVHTRDKSQARAQLGVLGREGLGQPPGLCVPEGPWARGRRRQVLATESRLTVSPA